jgi:hypothetical protein
LIFRREETSFAIYQNDTKKNEFPDLYVPTVLLTMIAIVTSGYRNYGGHIIVKKSTFSRPPDLNPIENLWYYVDNQIRAKNYSNINDLFDALNESWRKQCFSYRASCYQYGHYCNFAFKSKMLFVTTGSTYSIREDLFLRCGFISYLK